MIGKEIANAEAKSYNSKFTGVLKNLQQNNAETVTNKNDQEILEIEIV